MFRSIWQIISLQLVSVLCLSGCLALAAGSWKSSEDYSDRQGLRAIVWHLAGWLSPVEQSAGEPTKRRAVVSDPISQDSLELVMSFDDPLSTWPRALEVQCRPENAELSVKLTDSRPFGGPNLAGTLDPDFLTQCLSAFAQSLAAGPWLSEPKWVLQEPGLWFGTTQAFFGPRLGPKDLFLLKVSPLYFRLSPYHEAEKQSWHNCQVSISGWADRLPQAPVIFNSGQYYPNRGSMGLLKRKGQIISKEVHLSWKGFVVQDPVDKGYQVGILDLDTALENAPKPDSYGTVIQSYMVLDRLGRIRVKSTDRVASRMALGVDSAGNYIVVMALGAITLSDLATLMEHLGIATALGLDGGLEAQIAINRPEGLEILEGHYSNNFLGNFKVDDFQPSLPSVIALERLDNDISGPSGSPETSNNFEDFGP